MLPFLVLGQDGIITYSPKTLDQYIRDFSEIDGTGTSGQRISKFIARLDQKSGEKNSLKFSRTLFHKTRQEFLREYTQYASFGETLKQRKIQLFNGNGSLRGAPRTFQF